MKTRIGTVTALLLVVGLFHPGTVPAGTTHTPGTVSSTGLPTAAITIDGLGTDPTWGGITAVSLGWAIWNHFQGHFV